MIYEAKHSVVKFQNESKFKDIRCDFLLAEYMYQYLTKNLDFDSEIIISNNLSIEFDQTSGKLKSLRRFESLRYDIVHNCELLERSDTSEFGKYEYTWTHIIYDTGWRIKIVQYGESGDGVVKLSESIQYIRRQYEEVINLEDLKIKPKPDRSPLVILKKQKIDTETLTNMVPKSIYREYMEPMTKVDSIMEV